MNIFVLDVISTCNSSALSVVLPAIKKIMFYIQLIAPIVLLIMSVIEFVKLTINPEDKKGLRRVLNKVIAAFIIFLIPILVDMVMGIVGESTDFSSCWNNAGEVVNTTDPSDIQDENTDNNNKLIDEDGWESGQS